MKVTRKDKSDTEITLSVIAEVVDLNPIKEHVLKDHFRAEVKIPGFREGKAPLNMVEKYADQSRLQSQFLEESVNDLFSKAVNEHKLRPIDQPSVQVNKFVPFSTLEFEATFPVIGKVSLPDYKNIKLSKPKVASVTEKDIETVIDNIKKQVADKKDVERPAKDGDQVFIDFKGVDTNNKPVNGADGKNYLLVIGSNTFIPGFEPNLIGLKAGDSKTFKVTFPKDYHVNALANRDVNFTVDVIKVQEIVDPKVDDNFAAKVGPFKNVAELKKDIKGQLTQEKQTQAERDYESELLKKISDKSKVVLPEVLINGEVEKRLREIRENLNYRGQTFPEFLKAEGKTEKQYIEESVKPEAAERLKASIVLSEISEKEQINLTDEEIDLRMQVMRAQYRDPQAQAELDKPEARRDIASRLLAEKTIEKLVSYAQK